MNLSILLLNFIFSVLVHSTHDGVLKSVIRQVISDNPSGYTNQQIEEAQCVRDCIEEALNSQEMRELEEKIDTLQSYTQFNELFDSNVVRNLVLRTTSNCWSRCPENIYLDNVVKPMIASLEFMCMEPKFIDALPCYKDVFNNVYDDAFNETYNVCLSDEKCRGKRTNAKSDLNNEIFQCEYVDCVLKCSRQKMAELCDEEKHEILNSFFKKFTSSWSSFKKIHQNNSTLPKQCVQMGQD